MNEIDMNDDVVKLIKLGISHFDKNDMKYLNEIKDHIEIVSKLATDDKDHPFNSIRKELKE